MEKEVAEEQYHDYEQREAVLPLKFNQPSPIQKSPEAFPLQVIMIGSGGGSSRSVTEPDQRDHHPQPEPGVSSSSYQIAPLDQDAWLPITESGNGTVFTATFHLLSSGLGFQALFLPVAFSTLGWGWGITCLSLAFLWQLYTIWHLVQLHESHPGTRYSRFLHLALVAFGPKLGKLAAIFPVMYLSGGSCVMLIITGGGALELFFRDTCHVGSSLSGVHWFFVFTCIAIFLSQLPNLNSISGVSLIGGLTAVGYFTLIWVLSIFRGRPTGMSYEPLQGVESKTERIYSVLNAIGIILLSFRGHNLVLEIQGTLPSKPKHPSRKLMWKGVTMAYTVIALCLFSISIAGFWAYGNKMAAYGGMLRAYSKVHGPNTSKFVMGAIYILVVINSIASFQIYAMPVFDNLERIYITRKNQRCSCLVRTLLRLFFGGIALFVAITFPFLGSLSGVIGGMTLPLAYAYPCFMWVAIKLPTPNRTFSRCINLVLGCLGIVTSVLLVVAAVWTLADKGLDANFFHPR